MGKYTVRPMDRMGLMESLRDLRGSYEQTSPGPPSGGVLKQFTSHQDGETIHNKNESTKHCNTSEFSESMCLKKLATSHDQKP